MKHLEGCPSGDFGPCDCELVRLRAKLARAREALESIEDAMPVGIVITLAGIPIDHTRINEAMELVRSEIRNAHK